MAVSAATSVELLIPDLARRARTASRKLATTTGEQRRVALEAMADVLSEAADQIVAANALDLSAADAAGVGAAMRDRLLMDHGGVAKLADAVREIADQPDPLGEVTDELVRPNGLAVSRVRIPLGVVAMIYESRPNVTADAAALCLKAGNASILRGGKEAINSNRAIAAALRAGLESTDVPADVIQLIPVADRAAVDVLLEQDEYIDLVIPRGGEGLIRAVTEKSRIPVLQHYKGVCHIYVDASADAQMATDIVSNAKVQRPGVCNALETLLVHQSAAPDLLPGIANALTESGVELRGCARTRELLGEVVVPASEADWDAEYLDLILAVRIVDDLAAAIEHIDNYGSSHTEAIVTSDDASAQAFVSAVQSSTVLVNASTRFADGGQLGLGAEIGISTSKLHAFGPMGARELTTRKFVVKGTGQVRS
ncbi:MAG: glutamate-5-semialdehyde dehydrogenase [Gemmatimonadetes bacterium]|nr:glutamate-5-semialdehyde dehydrogenase [Gemmatimonadota bacterium]